MKRKIFLNRWLCRRIFVRLAWRDYDGIAVTPAVVVIWNGRIEYSPLRVSWLGLTFTAYAT